MKGFSADNIEKKIGSRSGLVIIDDLMNEVSSDPKLTAFFTKKVHHRGISVCFLVQRVFPPAKEFRTMSLNAGYFVLFKNPRDRSEIRHLGAQFCPGSKFLQESYMDSTSRPHGYLICDFRQECPERLRVRTNILPEEAPVVIYVRK